MVFLFMSQPDFACNPYALWKYITENTDHQTAWLVYKEERYTKLKERGIVCALYDTYEGNCLVENADYVIANSYTFRNINKQTGQIFANLWHGSGIKAHDFFNRNSNPNQLKEIKTYFDKVDLMCVHSLDDRFRLSAMLNYDLRNSFVTGQPRLDHVVDSAGRRELKRIYGSIIDNYDHLIFFAPSFRANMSGCSGTMLSDNVFRLPDYDDRAFMDFLKETNSLLIYKLHPIEQNAFKGRKFQLNERCIELTDEILFDNEIQYDNILNAFDIMITDYSSIAFDFLLLDRPIVYLLPDFDEYKNSKGFVFNNIDYYMPGEKAFDFSNLLKALKESIDCPKKLSDKRQNVINQRFDYTDGGAAKRCYETIISYTPLPNSQSEPTINLCSDYPSAADQIRPYMDDTMFHLVDGTKDIDKETIDQIIGNKEILYIIEEEYNSNSRLSELYKGKIKAPQILSEYNENSRFHVTQIPGGVDFAKFNKVVEEETVRKRIGFAGTIDSRIYFAMVQVICEAFPDYEVIFAGEILGARPAWLDGFDNLKYIETSYDKLPDMIASFEVCLLPFYGKHKLSVPCELFQYLSVGKIVVASDMPNLPKCTAILTCASIDESVNKIKDAVKLSGNESTIDEAVNIAKRHDWSVIAKAMLSDVRSS